MVKFFTQKYYCNDFLDDLLDHLYITRHLKNILLGGMHVTVMVLLLNMDFHCHIV